MDRFFILIIFGLLTSCASHKAVLLPDYLSTKNLGLKDIVNFEKKIRSTDKTPNHRISISDGIYPNKKNYELATPRAFVKDKGYFEREVEYYYSTPDSSVRVILYQWDKKGLNTFESKEELGEKFEEFRSQWDKLSKELNESLGLPTFKQIESDRCRNKLNEDNQSIEEMISSVGDDTEYQTTSWRDQMKWDTKDVHAYLFMFGDNRTGYRQIRLAIYGE